MTKNYTSPNILETITKCNIVYVNGKTIKDKHNEPELIVDLSTLTDIEFMMWERKKKTLHIKANIL